MAKTTIQVSSKILEALNKVRVRLSLFRDRPVHHSELLEWLLAKSASAIKELPEEAQK